MRSQSFHMPVCSTDVARKAELSSTMDKNSENLVLGTATSRNVETKPTWPRRLVFCRVLFSLPRSPQSLTRQLLLWSRQKDHGPVDRVRHGEQETPFDKCSRCCAVPGLTAVAVRREQLARQVAATLLRRCPSTGFSTTSMQRNTDDRFDR